MNSEPVELMLVEDNASDEELTLHVLQKNNLANRIHVVRDGAEALEFLFGNSGNVPKLILMDLKLPLLIRACYELGVNSYILKPVDFIQFTECVRQLGLYWLLFNEPAGCYSQQRA